MVTRRLSLLKGQWVEVDRDQLQQAIAHWENVRQQAQDGEISFVEGMRLLAGASADLEHEGQIEAERPWVHVQAGGALRGILSSLRHPRGVGTCWDGPRRHVQDLAGHSAAVST